MAQEQMPMPHGLTLIDRKVLTMTGVTEVISFDDSAVLLHTQLGALQIHGQQLQLKNLSLDGGQVAVEGNISALIYQERQKDTWLRRILG